MEMTKFETEVLRHLNYSRLLITRANLIRLKNLSQKKKELAMYNCNYNLAVEFEKNIIIINENLNNLDVVMMIKEAECFDLSGEYDMISLN